MKLDALLIPTTTRMEVVDVNGNDTGVFIVGHTPDSKEYRQAQAQIVKNQPIKRHFDRSGDSYIEIKVDPKDRERNIMLLASVVTDIEGLDDFETSYANVLELFSRDEFAYVVDQWKDHLDDRKNFTNGSAAPASTGSRSKRGPTQERAA